MTTTQLPPTTPETPDIDDPLGPVRRALLATASGDADAGMAAAQRAAAIITADASEQAEAICSDARAEGERDAEQVRVAQRARSRRRARAIVLAAQREALEDLRREVHRRVKEAWEQEGLRAELVQRLTATARAELGPNVQVQAHPAGGVVATADHARAIYLLTDLADQVIAATPDDLVRLWTP